MVAQIWILHLWACWLCTDLWPREPPGTHDKFHATICVLQRLVPSLTGLLVFLHLPQVPENQQNWALSWLYHHLVVSVCWDDWSDLHTCTVMCSSGPALWEGHTYTMIPEECVRMKQRGCVAGKWSIRMNWKMIVGFFFCFFVFFFAWGIGDSSRMCLQTL